MSSTSAVDDFTSSPAFIHTPASYGYTVTHVFFPIELPFHDYTLENDLSLARAVCAAAHSYSGYVEGTLGWYRITRMLDNLQASATSEHLERGQVISQLYGMQTGDVVVFFIRPQNAALILTKRESYTLFELFEVSPSNDAVEKTAGSLICSYPWSAVETPNEVFDNEHFRTRLANFLSQPHPADSEPPSSPPTGLQYIATLLASIFRGVGRTVDVPRITKRVRDHVGQWPHDSISNKGGWRRSSLWLLVRAAIQMLGDRSLLGLAAYKQFILFFLCTLAKDPNNTCLSSDLLHLMSSKVFRRLGKLGSATPDWLSELALNTCACLQETLDARWEPPSVQSSLFRNPSQDELRRDTQLLLRGSHEYLHSALANHGHEPLHTPFHPAHRRRGTIEDFLSSNGSFFEEAYDADPDVTLYDVEQSVEQAIDDWIGSVTNVQEACGQLEILMDKYMKNARGQYKNSAGGNPEDYSAMLLTAIELFVALDKLVVREIPMLADYSPDIPIAFLERLLLRKMTGLHRIARAYQYISARHSRSRPGWSVLSNEFTEDSFAARYYDQAPHLQRLKAHIEEEQECHQHQPAESAGVSRSPLPARSLHAKVVVFELHCPRCVRIWRSAVARILHYFEEDFLRDAEEEYEDNLLAHIPALRHHFVHRQGPPLRVQIHFAYFYPWHDLQSQNGLPILRYVLQHPHSRYKTDSILLIWQPEERYEDWRPLWNLRYQYNDHHSLWNYVNSTSHTSNDVLADLAGCPADLSLDEFITFGHLRSGGSLQWLNILRGLRNRSLNLRRDGVHFLLAHAASQVGPMHLNTGSWDWHQELEDPSFCNALLDELHSLFMEVGAGLIHGVMMGAISLLLTRVLASSPSELISERAIALLRSVRRKTFTWVQELSYNLAMAPMNEERSNHLWNMAATCRSTFDVDPATLCRVLRSAEDVDALLSCAILVHSLRLKSILDRYSQLLLKRDHRLSLAVEEILRDVILADASDYGVDLAVRKIFASHKPSSRRWESLQCPNARWLTCETRATRNQSSQTVHVNLLDGELRVDGQPLGGLPRAIRNSPECEQIFRDQGFFLIPSDLPGMDFTTLAAMSEHKVHFSLRDDHLVLRAQFDQTNDVLELIPSGVLRQDLPQVLLDGHVHWLNLSTKLIEICPLDRLWERSSDNWRIDCTSGQHRVYKGRETLVSILSPTWEAVAQCFNCARDLLITVSPIDLQSVRLSVALPHYELSFFVNEQGELESRDFKDMVYDDNQCIGALFGLESPLVLRQKAHLPDGFIHRRVVIRNGILQKWHGDRRVWVTTEHRSFIQPDDPSHYHTYLVDTELGCLKGNSSLMSTRYLAYLHAMTSSRIKPDPLTGKTGAHAALCLLQSAGCRSIMKLKAPNGDDRWTSTQYPQINIAYKKIRQGGYWNRRLNVRERISWGDECAAQRAAYLFPWNAARSSPLEDRNHGDDDCLTGRVPAEPGLPVVPRSVSPSRCIPKEITPWQITLDQLLSDRPAPELPVGNTLARQSQKTPPDGILELNQLLSLLVKKVSPTCQREYITRLDASAQRVREEPRTTRGVAGESRIEVLEKYYMLCRDTYFDALCILKKSLSPTTDSREQALERFGQWPPITADVLLRYLASTSLIDLSLRWKKCLVSFALLLLDLQRSRRLLRFALDGLEDEFSKELDNEGCDGWDPEDYPDWLLIQIQGNFLIRRAQAEAAIEMISPKSGQNTVLQVNMGEGKSSVIIPIAASALADGKQLVRVIVPKSFTVQMFELLVSRLGGLANRPIYHLPFFRSAEYDRHGRVTSLQIDDLHKLMSQCIAERGILLVQPEHVVSLQLMSVEEQIRKGKLVSNPLVKFQKLIHKHITTALSLKSLPGDSIVGNMFRLLSQSADYLSQKDTTRVDHSGNVHDVSNSASKWLNLQKWIHCRARDILDESDEILHPRFQLIYTIGLQQHVDGYPDRWTITQQILRLVKNHACSLSACAPDLITDEHCPPGAFPHIHFVRVSDVTVGRRLILSIAESVMAGRLTNLNFQNVSPALRSAIRSFISDKDVLPETAKIVEEYAKGSHRSQLWSGLLLLRGLLASNVLLFALAERRWRVHYGLLPQKRLGEHSGGSPAPTMLAVPYRAKDVPAPNTQFGHPDITIILTCLSYYYTGLSEEQLRASFEILLDQDAPFTEYALWMKEYDCESLPDSLRELSEINLKSSEQWDKVIFPLFARNQAAIDFYLSQVVFPKEAKEFPWKISGSSWDLAEKREKVVTGFSGTNDGHWLLPMSISQCDLDHQQGTDARALACLLQPENDSYMVTDERGGRQSTLGFLQVVAIQRPEIRVLLDVGAQILDLSNHQVAKAWLDIVPDTAGAVYFDENDELMVLTKRGTTQSMLSSPLSQQLDCCVVYLDHVHTRGTDIKLPIGSRAAVTLGPKVTKDSLVQGCMRMRKLGRGHSVMFFAPLEVDQSIRSVVGKNDPDTRVATADILCWAIHETWTDIQQRAPYWAQQGMSHKSRSDAWSRFCNNELGPDQLLDAWLQPEHKSLADLYAPCERKKAPSALSELDPEIRQRCKDLGVLSLPDAQMGEEQEREVSREQEREREVELPPRARPLEHGLHPDVVSFVNTGAIPPLHPGSAFRPVFTALEKSSAAAREVDVWSPFILATADFCKTVDLESTGGTMDQYLRPVQWILSRQRCQEQVLVLLSSFEADRLMPDIRASERVHLHVYAPRTSQRMKPSDDLRLYSIPPLPSDWTPPWPLIDQLNVFAGQLYLRDYHSYLRLCRFLDVPIKESPNGDTAPRRNTFNIPGSLEEDEIIFSESPLPFVCALLAVRKRGRPFTQTHMGRILQGQVLTEKKDFDQPTSVVSGHDRYMR